VKISQQRVRLPLRTVLRKDRFTVDGKKSRGENEGGVAAEKTVFLQTATTQKPRPEGEEGPEKAREWRNGMNGNLKKDPSLTIRRRDVVHGKGEVRGGEVTPGR